MRHYTIFFFIYLIVYRTTNSKLLWLRSAENSDDLYLGSFLLYQPLTPLFTLRVYHGYHDRHVQYISKSKFWYINHSVRVYLIFLKVELYNISNFYNVINKQSFSYIAVDCCCMLAKLPLFTSIMLPPMYACIVDYIHCFLVAFK